MVSTEINNQQLYSLTWSEYSTSLASSVQSLRGLGDLVDVTLAAGGRRFPAHKIVLSAASPFLLNLLKNTPCEHPIVMLAGVAAADLEALLEFVYRGEVSVDPEQLPSLLQAANCLGIQGLIPNTHNTERFNNDLSTTVPPAPAVATNVALTRDVINSFLPLRRYKRSKRRNSDTGGKWARLELENESGGTSAEHDNNTPRETASDQLNSDEQANKKSGASDQPGVCPVCGVTLRQSRNLRRHLELLHLSTKPAAKKKPPPPPAPALVPTVTNLVPMPVPAPMPAHMADNITYLLPPMTSPHEPVFRHQGGLLTGVGLYAEPGNGALSDAYKQRGVNVSQVPHS